MWQFALIFAWPLTEISLFVVLGGWIGLWATLAFVLGTGVLGMAILRGQGLNSVTQLRSSVTLLPDPAAEIARKAMVVVAALLLILPGFLTDALGLLLLVPPVQAMVLSRLRTHLRTLAAGFVARGPAPDVSRRPGPAQPGTVMDADFVEIDPPVRPTHTPSGWTRH